MGILLTQMKVVAFIGKHNSGKTTVIEQLIPKLRQKGYKVCYIKHDPKGHGITDKEGSDTWRISQVCEKLALLSPDRLTFWEKGNFNIKEVIKNFFKDCDIVILEGFKGEKDIPKIAVGNIEAEKVLLRIDSETEIDNIIDLIENMEELE